MLTFHESAALAQYIAIVRKALGASLYDSDEKLIVALRAACNDRNKQLAAILARKLNQRVENTRGTPYFERRFL